jgi:flagellar FliJ protein
MDSATLQALIARAAARGDAARLRLAGLQRLLDQARAHLQVLRQYAREYEDKARKQAGDRRDISAERNEQIFLGRLDAAVDTQQRDVEHREKAVGTAMAELALCLQRRKSLETLLQRQEDQRRRAQARYEQKQTDEFAQRAADATERGGMGRQTDNSVGGMT